MPSQNDESQTAQSAFSYFISHNNSILVASLSGLCSEEALETLQKCRAEIETRLAENIQGVIINFSGVTGMANEIIPFWAQLQVMIRSQRAMIRLCGIDTGLKERLTRSGIIRSIETSPSLHDAVPELVTALKKNPPLVKKAA